MYTEQKTYLRFELRQRIEHVLLIISFTTLAITGLSQKFPLNPVSIFIIDLLGGVEKTRIIHRFAAVLFGRRVTFGPDHGAFLISLKRFGNAKIHQNDMILGVDHHIGGLHIPKDDGLWSMCMQIMKHIAQFDCPADNPFFG